MSSDRETTRRVRSWLEPGVTAIPDHLLDAVLDQIPTTPQRRPLWLVRRYAMSTYARLGTAAVAVTVLVLGGTAFMLRGGVGGEASPRPSPSAPVPTGTPGTTAAATDAVLVPGEFTACVPSNSEFKTGTNEQDVEGDLTIERTRGYTWRGVITATDPRFTGTHYYSWDSDQYKLSSGADGQGSRAEGHRIETDDGAWQGWDIGVSLPDGTEKFGPAVLTGEGAYKGLKAVLLSTEGPCFFDFRGVVMDVPDPPVPYTGK